MESATTERLWNASDMSYRLGRSFRMIRPPMHCILENPAILRRLVLLTSFRLPVMIASSSNSTRF